MKRLPWFAGAAVAIAITTWVIGWWTVPVVGAVFGWLRRADPAAPLLAGLAGMLAWSVLLSVSASGAPTGSVSVTVGQAMRVGPGALTVLTLAFPGLLAASAAAVTRALGRGAR
jgi:hypothetical protein